MNKKREKNCEFDHADFRNMVWSKTGGQCYYCGYNILPFGRTSRSFHIDHVIPVHEGGTDDPGNLVPSCGKCNCQKHNKTLEEYRLWLGISSFWFETGERHP
jgi:5-methylcytosine-specific restriction endonuclease McrA